MSIVIKGAKTFLDDNFSDYDILLENDRIVDIGKSLDGDEKVNAKGMLLIPGLIDPHVHFREPGLEYKEDFRTGTHAAIAGGFTTVMDMPNNKPPTTTFVRLKEKRKLAEKAVCDVRFHFGSTDSNFDEVRRVNPKSMKVYLGKTTGELFLRKSDSLKKHIESLHFESILFVHASGNGPEEQAINETIENINNVGRLSTELRKKFYIAHASCEQEIVKTKEHKGFVEVSPHHLFLSSKDAEKLGNKGTVYPELRSEERRKSLWRQLNSIDCIGTDHAPHTLEDKEQGAHGFPGLETALPLMLDAYNKKLLKLEYIIPRMTSIPAKIFGLTGLGEIKKGNIANLTLVDLKKEWKVKGEELQTKCKWSPFEGRILKGKANSVFYKGKLVFEDNQFR